MFQKFKSLVALLISLFILCSVTPAIANQPLWFQSPKNHYRVLFVTPRPKESNPKLDTALRWWNEVLHHKVFERTNNVELADIMVFDMAMPGECDMFLNCILAETAPPIGSPEGLISIQVFNKVQDVMTYTHELGHALGLDHSDQENSVMYPYLEGNQGFMDETIHALDYKWGT
jgi:matrixin